MKHYNEAKKSNKLSLLMKTGAMMLGLALTLQMNPAHADKVHKAKEGDTFYLLGKQFGVPMNRLMSANPKVDPMNIYDGLTIRIPDSSKQVFKASFTTAQFAGSSLLSVSLEDNMVKAWGKTFNFTKTINVLATAYSAAASENGKWGAVDYYGNPLKLGTIAVDPMLIPMGTKVLVTGHTHPGLPKQAFVATAMDQGSAIKGNRIDIFIPGSQQKVRQFGFQDIKLYVLN